MGAVLNERAAPPPAALAWTVWGLGAMLYLIAYYHRVAPAVMTQELSREFGLSAAALGNLSAFYFYSYVAVQIPTGLLADRFGPRRVLAAGAALTALGTLLFALAPDVRFAMAGRLAIGAAGGVAFVSMLKLASHWMPFRQFAFVSGVALFMGVLGATIAGAPLRVAVDAFGWRHVMLASAVVAAVAAVAIWLVARDDPSERGYASYHGAGTDRSPASIAAQLRNVLSHRNAWILFLLPGGLSCVPLAFAGLWGVPWLVSQHGFTTRAAATVCSAMLLTWAVASMVFGPVSQKIGRRKPVFVGGLLATLLLWSIVVFVPLPASLLVPLLLLAAFTGGTFIVTFALARESVPAHLGGTSAGIANMGVMLGGMVMQPLIGFMLDAHWEGMVENGARIYGASAWRWGFSLMLAWAALSLVLVAFSRESYCQAYGTGAGTRASRPGR